MIPKYKYKYQNQRHAGTTVQYCRFKIMTRGRFLTPFGWRPRDIVIQKFEVFTPAFRHVNYEKPVMADPVVHEENSDVAEWTPPETKRVDTLVPYDMEEVWNDFEEFYNQKNEELDDDRRFYMMIEREGHLIRK